MGCALSHLCASSCSLFPRDPSNGDRYCVVWHAASSSDLSKLGKLGLLPSCSRRLLIPFLYVLQGREKFPPPPTPRRVSSRYLGCGQREKGVCTSLRNPHTFVSLPDVRRTPILEHLSGTAPSVDGCRGLFCARIGDPFARDGV